MVVSVVDARRVGDDWAVNWDVVPVETFQAALVTELEHADVTHGDLMTTGRIALAHLREDPDYYTRLARIEAEAEAYWSTHDKPSPTLGGGMPTKKTVNVVFLVFAIIAIIAFFAFFAFFVRRYWRGRHMEGFFRGALGYETPTPGNPNCNVLRRSQLYLGRYPSGGLGDCYF
jgi:hypothetical protein